MGQPGLGRLTAPRWPLSASQGDAVIQPIRDFFGPTLAEAKRRQLDHLDEHRQRSDRRTIVILVSVAVLLTIRAYFFRWADLQWLVERLSPWWPALRSLVAPEHAEFSRLVYWCLGQNLTYVVGPLLLIKLVLRDPLTDYGVKLRGMFRFASVYLAMFLLMAPLIFWLSQTRSFQHTYPFYQPASGEPLWPKLIVWELLYASQFVALEFFFRGYMVHGTKHQFGPYCVLVMAVPYCMIHFQKPLPETLGAVIAGIVLGLMSLKTRSIWMGAALHIAVAWSMDAAALAAR